MAHFLERPFWCENQILQGADSFLSPQKLRYGTNAIGAWGPTLLTPWFNYGKEVCNFPPVSDWRQPWWPQFHIYADYARRIAFMNAQGHHAAPVLLYYPMTSVWANALGPPSRAELRKSRIDLTEKHYTDLMNRLVGNQWDFDVTDDHFLHEGQDRGGHHPDRAGELPRPDPPPDDGLSPIGFRQDPRVLRAGRNGGGDRLAADDLDGSRPG